MNNGLAVTINNNTRGVIVNSNDPAKKIFNLNIKNESRYVTHINVRFVKIVNTNKGFRVNESTGTNEVIKRVNYTSD